DLTVLGKIIGGGLPVGAYGGRKEIMDLIAPLGPVYQAGTLSGNPLAVSAGIETLRQLKARGVYKKLEEKSAALAKGIGDDGCSAQCKLEKGWACPSGGVCRAIRCGDGLRIGAEQCDDGNGASGDGCSSTCLLESPAETEADGWLCATAGQPCTRTMCGNG